MLAVRFLILALGLLAGWVAGQAIPDAAEPSVTLVNTLSLMLAGLLLAVLLLPRVEDWDDPNLSTVDDKLIRLARETGSKLVTNDSNLSKIAKLHGLHVLSIHEAAVALKPQLQAGEHLTVVITKSGQQAGQGVGYLDDGTMVVVEDGLRFRNRPTRVQVVNNVQTNVGRMIFARPDKDSPGKDPAGKDSAEKAGAEKDGDAA